MAAKQKKGGRVTPPRSTSAPAEPADSDKTPQVGRRPSNPLLLFGIAIMWVAVGIYILVGSSAGWRVIPAILAVGIGALFMRGAVLTVQRHDERVDD